MLRSNLRTGLAALVAASASGVLLAQPRAPEPKLLGSPEMAETEAKVAKIRELVRPQPGEHVANMEKIAWEHDPWEAAVKAAKEGKPILAWGECGAGVPCGYG